MKLTYEQVLEYENVDNEKFIELLEELANDGDVEAQHKLGLVYYYGEIVPEDINKAFYYFEKLANEGYYRIKG